MAGGVERELRRRIRTVEAMKKITRAMQLIAASQMVRAQQRIAGSRPYVDGLRRVLAVTATEAVGASRLIGVPENPATTLVVVIVGDRGLSGAYSSNVLRRAERHMQRGNAEGRSYRLVTVGRKAQSFFRFRGRAVDRAFTGMSDRPTFEDARRVANEVVWPFLAGEVDRVQLFSTRFRSAGVQYVERRQLLPLPRPEDRDEHVAPGVRGQAEATDIPETPAGGGFYDFEPSPEDLLRLLVPQYAEAEMFRALLEASASEHTARQRAMAAATENAEELVTAYRRAMNRARQDSITTEIMEIVGGAEALRRAGDSGAHHDLPPEHSEEHIA